MHRDDSSLVERFTRERDETAFRALYRLHTPMLFALAVRLTGSRSQAEELTQEAWVRAVERHDRFGGRSRYSTWVTGILINCFRESLRAPDRQTHEFDERRATQQGNVVAPFPTARREQDLLDVERALMRLAPGYREIVLLHDLNGHTHEEIGAMLGISAGTSKSQLQRGRGRLRELLDVNDAKDQRGTP